MMKMDAEKLCFAVFMILLVVFAVLNYKNAKDEKDNFIDTIQKVEDQVKDLNADLCSQPFADDMVKNAACSEACDRYSEQGYNQSNCKDFCGDCSQYSS